MDFAPVFRRQPRQIQHLRLDSRRLQRLFGDHGQTPALGHLAGTGVFGSRRAVDQQGAQRPLGVIVPNLRRLDRRPRRDPVDRQVVVGVGVSRPGLARHRALAALDVAVPGHGGDLIQRRPHRVKGRVLIGAQEAGGEVGAAQFRRGHAPARVWRLHGVGHGVSPASDHRQTSRRERCSPDQPSGTGLPCAGSYRQA
ncbi:hypothetical protein D3C80_1428800 [compost metagenome]